MSTNPELLRSGLSELADQAEPLRLETSSIARRIRHRRTAKVSAAAAACAAIAIGAATLASPSSPHSPTVAAQRSASERPVSFHGLEVRVPSSWATNAEHCGAPTRDTVLTLDHAIEACALVQERAFDDLSISRYLRPGRPAGGTPRKFSLGGHPAATLENPGPNGYHAITLDVPDLDVTMTAITLDPALGRRIIGSARVARPRDSAGCLDPVPSLTPRLVGVGGSKMVPDGFVHTTICAYDNLRVNASVLVGSKDAKALAAQLDSLTPGLQKLGPLNKPGKRSAPQSCTPYIAAGAHNGFVVRFSYPHGGLAEIVIRWDGCDNVGVTNGTRSGHVTYPLLQTLQKLTGHPISGTALEDFVP